MQQAFAQIISDGGIQNVASAIAPLEEIFRLQNMAEHKRQEDAFLR